MYSVKRTMLAMRKKVLIIQTVINAIVRVSSTESVLPLSIEFQNFKLNEPWLDPSKSAFKHNMKLVCRYTEHNLDQSECLDFNSLIYSGCQARVYQKFC